MCLRLIDSGQPYLGIHVLPTPCSCLSITLYCLHLLTLDRCATLDVVFTRAVYGAATEPRVLCARPSLGSTRGTLVSRHARHDTAEIVEYSYPTSNTSLTSIRLIRGNKLLKFNCHLVSFHCFVSPCPSWSVGKDPP